MFQRDRIFYAACGLSGIGIVVALLGSDLSIFLFVAAYLLRPALHEFGLAKQYADERQLQIHSRSGNIAFIVMVVAAVGLGIWRVSRGKSIEELNELLFIGLAARAITGLVMGGEYRKAGATIIGAVGFFLGLFITLDAGLPWGALAGAGLALLIIVFARVALRNPRSMAVLLTLLVLSVIAGFKLYEFRTISTALWLFFVTPLACAVACLFLGSGKDRAISPRMRTLVFGGLAVAATLVFCLLIIFGDRGKEEMYGGSSTALKAGEITMIQGVACTQRIERYANGKLEFCSLARDQAISGQQLPASTGVHFTPEGIFDWCFLQQDTQIQGHLCRGSGHNFITGFYPDGKLRGVYQAEDEVIDDVPCSRFRFPQVFFSHGGGTSFHENGRLKSAVLSRESMIQGHRFRRGKVIYLDAAGKLLEQK